jgi:hypothetical protein
VSAPKFTPGPWKLTDDPVRRVIRGGETKQRSVCIIDDWTLEADARLIAAAPELYRVVNLLAEDPPSCVTQPEKAAGHGECDCWACCLVNEARAALAKAVTP